MKIALIVPASSGHIFPMLSLANQLKNSEYEIIICSQLDGQEKIEAAGFNFYPIAKNVAPKGFFKSVTMNNNTGFTALFQGFNTINKKVTQTEIEDLAEFITREKPDLLIIDSLQIPAIAVSEKYEIPYFIISATLPIGFDANIPPIITPWQYDETYLNQLRNKIINYVFNKSMQFTRSKTNEYARKNNLPKFQGFVGVRNCLAYITQIPSQFYFTQKLPKNLYYTGPFVNDRIRKSASDFPWEKLNSKPIVYASLGTVLNNKPEIFKTIAAAFEGIEAQLIMSVGARISQEQIDEIPGEPLIVRFAPQL